MDADPRTQDARLALRFGRRVGATLELHVTSAGLLAAAGLVSAILLSTTLLVQVAVREGRRPRQTA